MLQLLFALIFFIGFIPKALALSNDNTWLRIFAKHCESCWIDPEDSAHILVSSAFTLYSSTNGGKSWDTLYRLPRALMIRQIEVSNLNNQIIFLNCTAHPSISGLFRSLDGGKTFDRVAEGAANGHTLYLKDSLVLYGSMWPAQILHSSDLGTTWREAYPPPILDTVTKRVCTFLPVNDTTLLLGTKPATIYQYTPSLGWHIVFSRPLWQEDEVPQIITANKDCYAILQLGASGMSTKAMLRSSDQGTTWIPLESPMAMWSIVYDTLSQSLLVGQFSIIDEHYPGSSIYSFDLNTQRWSPLGTLKENMVWQLQLNRRLKAKTIYACTNGGLYRMEEQLPNNN